MFIRNASEKNGEKMTQNLVGTLTRRSVLKLVGLAGAAGAAGSFIAQSAVAATSKINKKGSGVVNYWNHFTGADERAAFKKVTDGFATASPKIQLKVQTITNDDWMTKYVASVAAQSGPDALMMTAPRFGDMLKLGGVQDISTYVNQWPGAAECRDSLKAFQTKGKTYGVPVFTFVDWLYYRKDLFDAAGIKEAPKTLKEFRQAAIALSNPSKGIYGFGMRGGSGGGGFVPRLIHAYNGPIINPRTLTRTVRFEALRDALAFWVNLAVKDKAVPPTVTGDAYVQIMQGLATGKTAMVMHHTGSFVTAGTYWKYGTQLETAPMPTGPKGPTGFTSPLANAMFKGAKNPDGAFEFLSYWGSAPAQVEFLKATGYFPTASSASQDVYVQATPQYKAAFDALKNGYIEYTFPGYDVWTANTCLPELQKALNGSQKIDTSARNIYNELGRICQANSKALFKK
jgi:multiple sugar transport system substrate-binding protein